MVIYMSDEETKKVDKRFGGNNGWHKKLEDDPEFKKKHFEKVARRRAEYWEKQHAMKEEAKSMVPRIMAERELAKIEKGNYEASPETIFQIRELMNKGYKLEKIRKDFIKMPQKEWDKLVKALFKNHYNQIEELGIDLISAKTEALKDAKRSLLEVKKEIKKEKRYIKLKSEQEEEKGEIPKNRSISASLLNLKHQLEKRKYDIEMELADILHKVGAVGDKAVGQSIHYHFATPRPKVKDIKDGAIDVTPED